MLTIAVFLVFAAPAHAALDLTLNASASEISAGVDTPVAGVSAGAEVDPETGSIGIQAEADGAGQSLGVDASTPPLTSTDPDRPGAAPASPNTGAAPPVGNRAAIAPDRTAADPPAADGRRPGPLLSGPPLLVVDEVSSALLPDPASASQSFQVVQDDGRTAGQRWLDDTTAAARLVAGLVGVMLALLVGLLAIGLTAAAPGWRRKRASGPWAVVTRR